MFKLQQRRDLGDTCIPCQRHPYNRVLSMYMKYLQYTFAALPQIMTTLKRESLHCFNLIFTSL